MKLSDQGDDNQIRDESEDRILDIGEMVPENLIPMADREPPTPFVSLFDCLDDPNLFGPWLKEGNSWTSWMVFLKSLFNEPMSSDELEIFRKCTSLKNPPAISPKEIYLIVGRRGGKSFFLSMLAVYLACFYDWSPYLSPGEKGSVFIVATDRKQARIIFGYIESYLKNIKFLRKLLVRDTMESFELSNSINIEIQTASFRSIRGYTIVAALLDEVAFWKTEDSSNPDFEILNAIRPAMSTIPGAKMFCASSPYVKQGVLWDGYRKYYGKSTPGRLVWKAPTLVMNPILDPSIIEEAYKEDPLAASSEYGAEFRNIGSYSLVDPDIVDSLVDRGITHRPPNPNFKYTAFVDPSGGSKDSFVLSISHEEDGIRVMDMVKEVEPPFSPDTVVKEFCQTVKEYGIVEVTGDRYAGIWPSERFRAHGVDYVICPKTKTQIYLELLPMINSGTVKFIDNKKIVNQLKRLDRRVSKNGRELVDHPVGSHDDVINAAAGSLVMLQEPDPIEIW